MSDEILIVTESEQLVLLAQVAEIVEVAEQGPPGPPGADGPPGPGVPVGGTTGQVLSKSSDADYATAWVAPPSSGREILTASRTYYVRKDGSDANTGLTDTAGGAFLTIQEAVNAVVALDFGGQPTNLVTIQVADGTYEEAVTLSPLAGLPAISGGIYPVRLVGNTISPNNVAIYPAGGYAALTASGNGALWRVEGFHFNGSRLGNYGYAVVAMVSAWLSLGIYNITTNAGVYALVAYDTGTRLTSWDWLPLVLAGPCRGFAYCDGGSFMTASFSSVSLGSLAVTEYYLQAFTASALTYYAGSHIGSATGKRFYVGYNSLLSTYGSGINFPPGSIAGEIDTATGGIYI